MSSCHDLSKYISLPTMKSKVQCFHIKHFDFACVELVNAEINPGLYLFADSLICIGCVSVWAQIRSWSQWHSHQDRNKEFLDQLYCILYEASCTVRTWSVSQIADIKNIAFPRAWSVSRLNDSDWGLKEDTQEIHKRAWDLGIIFWS